MHSFIHPLTSTHSISIHLVFTLHYVLEMLMHLSHELRPQGTLVEWLRETSIEQTTIQCQWVDAEKEASPGSYEGRLETTTQGGGALDLNSLL